uniref:Uncharacterized protein n=1 Tax=Geospiza parvula TaxID=87175 RepID=A0A8C3MFI4_GEOPR
EHGVRSSSLPSSKNPCEHGHKSPSPALSEPLWALKADWNLLQINKRMKGEALPSPGHKGLAACGPASPAQPWPCVPQAVPLRLHTRTRAQCSPDEEGAEDEDHQPHDARGVPPACQGLGALAWGTQRDRPPLQRVLLPQR